jgi:hypothetical protein
LCLPDAAALHKQDAVQSAERSADVVAARDAAELPAWRELEVRRLGQRR